MELLRILLLKRKTVFQQSSTNISALQFVIPCLELHLNEIPEGIPPQIISL